MSSVNESMCADIRNDGKPTAIEFGDSSIRTPSTLSGMTIHSTQEVMFPSSDNAEGTRGKRPKSKLEQSGRHKKYLWYEGGKYSKKSFDDSTAMFLLVCGMGRINCTGEQNNWELMRNLKRIPAEMKERCEGELSVTVDDVGGEDSITLVKKHTCGHKCPLLEGGKTTVLHESRSQLCIDILPKVVHNYPGDSVFLGTGTQLLFDDETCKNESMDGINNDGDQSSDPNEGKINEGGSPKIEENFEKKLKLTKTEEQVRRGLIEIEAKLTKTEEHVQCRLIEIEARLTKMEEQVQLGLIEIEADKAREKSERAWMMQFKDEDEYAEGDEKVETSACVDVNEPGLVRVGDVDVVRDDRPPFMLFMDNPQSPYIDDSDKRELMRLLEQDSHSMFAGLVGGRIGGVTQRHYTSNLKSFPDVYNLVERCMSRYIAEVQTKYPKLKHYKLAVVRSAPNAKSQYEGNQNRLHSDYDCIVNLRPPHERPVSLMVALDEFNFMYLHSRAHARKQIITQSVKPGQAVAFTNYCLHAGGPNDTNEYRHRLFAYMVSHIVDLPDNRVYNFHWKRVNEDEGDDVLVETEHQVPVGHDVQRTRSGRIRIAVIKAP